MSHKSGDRALKYLEKFGINVVLNKMVRSFEDGSVKLSNEDNILSNCMIWAAGVMGNIVEGINEDSVEKSRYLVDDFNLIKGYSNIYAIGDVASQKSKEFPGGLPMLAPVAIQQAKNIGSNFLKMTNNKSLKAFKYLDKGTMATIGRNKAVVDTPIGIKFGGFIGWFIWMFVHLVSIIGFRRKLLVFANWVWNYVTYSRGNRLIINK
jgi:NADH dehydrogenase